MPMTPQEELEYLRLKKQKAANTKAAMDALHPVSAAYEKASPQERSTTALKDVLQLGLSGATAGGSDWLVDKVAGTKLQERAADARERQGLAGFMSEMTGGALPFSKLTQAPTWIGRAGKSAVVGGGYSGASEAFSGGTPSDIGVATGLGAGAGLLASPLIDAIGHGATSALSGRASRLGTKIMRGAPKDAAEKLQQLGPEASLIDILQGKGLHKAQRIMETNEPSLESFRTFVKDRVEGSPQRYIADVEGATGVAPGATPNSLEEAMSALRKGPISKGYNDAAKEFTDFPRIQKLDPDAPPEAMVYLPTDRSDPIEGFDDLLSNTHIKSAYSKAKTMAESFKLAKGTPVNDLTELDLTIRNLGDTATAKMKTDPTEAEMYGVLARRLRERLDDKLTDPTYADARELYKQVQLHNEAVNLGGRLSVGKPSADTILEAKKITEPTLKSALEQGYGAGARQQIQGRVRAPAETLARGEARSTALGPDTAKKIESGLEREKTFKDTIGKVPKFKEDTSGSLRISDIIYAVPGGLSGFLGSPQSAVILAMAGAAASKAGKYATRKLREKSAPQLMEMLKSGKLPPVLKDRIPKKLEDLIRGGAVTAPEISRKYGGAR